MRYRAMVLNRFVRRHNDNPETVITPHSNVSFLGHSLSIMKLMICSLMLVCLCAFTALAQTPNENETPEDVQAATRARTITTRLTYTPQPVDPLAALRTGRVIYVKSSS